MSELIVLDYSDAAVHIYHDAESFGDIEDFLYERNDFKESEIEWMIAPRLSYHHHTGMNEVVFRIDREEIEDIVGEDISDEEMKKILSYIENDEGIWEAIEVAKREAIASIRK